MSSTTVNFNLKTAGFANYANQTLTFKLLQVSADKADDTVILPGIVTATSAANGTGSAALFTTGESDIESTFEVIFPNREKGQFKIPATSAGGSINLSDLLVDHVPGGADTQQSTVYDAAVAYSIQRANHTGTQTISTISDATEGVEDIVGGMVTGNTETGITVTYEDSDGTLDFVVASQTDENFTTADHAKLDGIETSATADQTNAEIRAAVEAATDSNVFTDADHTKLNGIEASATTDQTASEIRALVESATDSNVFTDADHTKLNTIAGSTTEEIQDIAGALVATGGTKTGIAVTYDDANNNMDFVVASQTDENFTTADHAKLDSLDVNAKAQVNFVPRSISFTNTSAFLSLADNAALDVDAGDFTLAFWAKLSNSGTEPILTKLSGTGYRLKFVSGNLILTMQDSGGSADFTLATGLADNKWHVYVVTVDRSGNAIAYVDNVAQTGVGVSGTASTLANGGQFQIGSDGGSNAGDGIALGNYVVLYKGEALDSDDASLIYFSADVALTAGSGASLMVDLRKADKTFTDLSTNALAVTTNGTIIFNEGRITSLDGVGDINCSSISADVATTGLNVIFDGTDTGDNKITLTDNLASALDITESTNSYLKFTTTNTGEKVVIGKALDISGATTAADVTGTNVLATTTLGYKAGSGGTATQGTSKSTAVALNKATGQITLNGAALAANTPVTFTFTNSTIAANDILVFNHVSAGTIGAYNFNAIASSGSAVVTVRNITSVSLAEAPVVSFAVIKAVTS